MPFALKPLAREKWHAHPARDSRGETSLPHLIRSGTRVRRVTQEGDVPARLELEISRMERTAVKLPIEPAEHSNFGGAQSFEPAVDEKIGAD